MELVCMFQSIPVRFQSVLVCPSSRDGLLAGSECLGIGGLLHVARVRHENIGNHVYTAQGILEHINIVHIVLECLAVALQDTTTPVSA